MFEKLFETLKEIPCIKALANVYKKDANIQKK